MIGQVPAITCILTGHREGAMLGLSLRSMIDAIKHAEEGGLPIQKIAVLDAPSPHARLVFAGLGERDWLVEEVDFRDQGLVRNHAVGRANGRYIAFLDGDDLWSENWLAEAYGLCELNPGNIIAHPEYNWLFHESNSLFLHADQEDPWFDPELLRISNYWDALCLAPREVYRRIPFSRRDTAEGFAFEDWHWNCATLAAGYVHRVAANTIHFKRRRAGSQTVLASATMSVMRFQPFLDYGWWSSQLSSPSPLSTTQVGERAG